LQERLSGQPLDRGRVSDSARVLPGMLTPPMIVASLWGMRF
jgi:hypothetical protein